MAGIELRGLPRIEENTGAAAEAAFIANQRLDTIRTTIQDMSTRLNIKLGSMATMLTDFFDTQNRTIEPVFDKSLLFGINVKLGSIAMILSDFFDDVRNKWVQDALLNDGNSRPPSNPGPRPSPPERGPSRSLDIDWTGMFGKLLTGLGIAFLATKINFGEAIEQSGIIAYVTKGLTKAIAVGSGLTKAIASIAANPAIAAVGKVFGAILHGINTFATRVIPLYGYAMRLGAVGARMIPFFAIVTSIVDFVKGFMSADTVWEGVKRGIAEVATGWIGWPLEILKDIVSWAAGKLGFENFSEYLDSFDLVGKVRDLAMKILNVIDISQYLPEGFLDGVKTTISDSVNWLFDQGIALVKSVFTIGPIDTIVEYSKTIYETVTGFLSGMVANIDDYIRGLFGVDEETWEKAKADAGKFIIDSLWSTINDIKTFFVDLFNSIADLIPTKEQVVNQIKGYLPDFITGEGEYSAENRLKDIEAQIKEQTDFINRSKAGEDVFNGPEDWGRNRALRKIEQAQQIKEEIQREMERRKATAKGGDTTINVVKGGNTTNATSTNINNFSSTPSSVRPD
ncbi:hypothetical protein PHIM7_108 [Sinorhizobium phage phiM7]|uniref:Uncharacterized protein n=2 Tax=Emdodecavirus TaxID=1980937 RepID=S5MAZ6_9CAUD|nr:hypothetical protein AB690_gp122 [Sinorhizobium phage phiM12]YP_009601233.1 hypothetical protein FDH46_gp108 [Sinorhizobium phage phiM7]AGR47798.1 hypothetical protein SmphiM12_166 [Sinorhizobium phage phiM12]AKF12655.1 hypothetical protein PHIM7_108 [Sinorhizobium phage phiM7]AKF13015.1 hypothetical protein PHIM19_109 [Sinorhizobium phage phiM19]